ncbi:MAG: serine/threonine-protein phosphatase, partial [Clostridia bacterium]|nr:serine/threonine-protein phosphatase [Clostridia bacterium]
ELCGDSIEITRSPRSTIIILSDGLGSGVKANILSSLTAKIAAGMLKRGCRLDEVIETLASTLPVCQVRHLAYSTFTILEVSSEGTAYLAEFDNPSTIAGGRQGPRSLDYVERVVGDRKIKEAVFELEEGDWLVLLSDGVLHAGIGGIWNLGWGWDRVNAYVQSLGKQSLSAREMADDIIALCLKLYGGKPGDDASVVAVKAREERSVAVMVGPPADPNDDEKVVKKFLRLPGKKVVCGGTTGNIVAKYLGKEIVVDLDSTRTDLPPTGKLEGIDLVTEGMLTLTQTLVNLQDNIPPKKFMYKLDGVSRLTLTLLEADRIHFIVGRAINPAHQVPNVPPVLALKRQIIDDIIRHLKRRGKKVTV